ncbi:N-acetyltransferase [Stagnimonas aquatica]|uniref:N-acetyltransferase n=1 Tax=Stagnimonas aquatica TaxID=2689987 RepID=A0A3N0VKA7_9GAMM|nr:GNAT family N-acetyltransferase [Stagnimonas aquatica]ROH93202.1 N-acetyltransferase [Stagnimonas aquatica]
MFKRWLAKPPGTFNYRFDDGLRVQVSPVRPEHAPRFEAGYQQLSEASRRMRFFGQLSGLSSKQLEFLTRPDGRLHLAYGALNLAQPEEPGVGVARCIRLDGDSRIAEVGITILDQYQGRGVGQLLHACLHRAGHVAGLKQFIYDVSADNERFIRHLLALGARQVSRDRDVVRLMMPVYGSGRAVHSGTASAAHFKTLLEAVAAAEPATPLA